MTVRVGIIGTGGISRAHQQTYEKVGGFEIVAVCDIIKSRANAAADQSDWIHCLSQQVRVSRLN